MAPNRRLLIGVDVDGLDQYRRIHGLPAAGPEPEAWTVGVPRFLALFERLGLRATFFAIAADLEHPAARAVAERVLAAGHELASHSWHHPYDLVRLPAAAAEAEIVEADRRLRALTGGPIAGYRAPGYAQSPAVLATLARLGYRYDSSAFPCPPYVAAKALIMAGMALTGRPSRSILHRPLQAFGARTPHRLRTAAGPLWSLPISVLPGLRFPLIGTALTALGPRGVAGLAPLVARMRYVNLEFHALDLLELQADGLDPVFRVQPDLRVPVAHKTALFEAFLGRAGRAAESRTLAEFAAECGPPAGA